MKQTAVEWLFEELHSSIEKFKNHNDYVKGYLLHKINAHKQAREMEKQQQDEFAIGFADWLTNEKSEYSVMYGNQEKRFATFNEDFTIKELLEIYKKEKGL